MSADRISRWFAEVAARRPDQVALADDDREITYAELDRFGAVVAQQLADAAVPVGEIIGLRCRRGWRVVAAVLGAWKHGCAYVPVDPSYPQGRQDQIIREAGVGFVVEDSSVALAVRRVDRGQEQVAVRPPDTAYVLFTSGSTGAPKGVVITHGNLRSLFEATLTEFGFTEADRWSLFHSHNFDFSVWETWGPLLSGGTCVIVPEDVAIDPATLPGFLIRHQVSVLSLVPSVLRVLADALASAGTALPGIRHVILGGEAFPPALATRWLDGGFAPAATVRNMYGITEVCVHATVKVVEQQDDSGRSSIGRPLSNTRIVLADGDTQVPDGSPGEILVSGGGVAWGYLGRSDLTAERFVRLDLDGTSRTWYRSGDFALRDADGELRYLGRKDDQVKVRGFRVELAEIEHVLATHPLVANACVVPLPVADGVDIAVAWERVSPSASSTDLRDWIRQRLPPAFVPRHIRLVDHIPLNPNGKTDRRRVNELFATTAVAAEGDAIAELWAERVGTGTAGFLSEGGNSLGAVQLLADIRQAYGIALPISLLLRANATPDMIREALRTTPASRSTTTDGGDRQWSPLGPGQKGLLVLDELNPRANAYNVVGVLHLQGKLSQDKIRDALREAVARRDILCARIVTGADDEPLWYYGVAPRLDVRFVAAADPLDDEMIERFARRAGSEPLPVRTRPLVTAAVLMHDDEACVVLCMHHMVGDEVSLDLLFKDFAAACAGHLTVDAPPRFADYAVAASAEVDGPRWTLDLEYWRALLADAPPETQLPFRRGIGPVDPARTGILGIEDSTRLDGLLKQRSVTVFTFFLACLSLVLRGWSGQPTVVVGTPAVRRRSATDAELVGFLLSTLPIRIDVGTCRDFTALLDHVRDRSVAALEHDTPPFDAVVEALALPRYPGRNPVFNVWFNDLTGQAPPPVIDGVRTRRVAVRSIGPLFEHNFYLRKRCDGYELELICAADGVPADLAAELVSQVLLVARQAIAGVSDVDDFSLVTAAGEAAGAVRDLLVPDLVRGPGLVDAILDNVAQRPDAIAVSGPDCTITYRELDERVRRLAGRLRFQGVHPGSVVEILGERTSQLPITLLAVWRLSAVAALVDSTAPAHWVMKIDEVVQPGHRIRMSGDLESAARGSRKLPGVSHILATSGTSGTPRAVSVSADVISAAMAWYTSHIAATGSDKVALLAGLGHDPMLRDMLLPLLSGGCLVIPGSDVFGDPERLVTFIHEANVTVLHATPALLEILIAGMDARPDLPLNLRLVVSAGAALPATLVRRFRAHCNATVANAFGTTETPQIATWRAVGPDDLIGDGTVPASASGGTGRVTVVTATGEPAGVGQRGEIMVRSNHLARGYLDDPQDARFGVEASGVRTFLTGDLGRLDLAGAVHVDGRVDRRLDVNGFRVEPVDVENAALGFAGVRSAVLSAEDSPGGLITVLYVVGNHVDLMVLRQYLRSVLPAYAVPTRVEQVHALQTGVNHKVLARPAAVPLSASASRDGTLARVLGTIREVVGRDVAPDENFFDAGLTSVSLVRLHRRLAGHVPLTALFAHPNARALAGYMKDGDNQPRPRQDLQPDGDFVERLRERRNRFRTTSTARHSGGQE